MITHDLYQCGIHHLCCANGVVEQLNGTQLKDLVQEGGRLVDVDRHGSLAGWISHCLVKILQPGEMPCNQTHTRFWAMLKFNSVLPWEREDNKK